MDRMNQLYTITEKILTTLKGDFQTNDERMKVIGEVNGLLEDREEVLKTILPPYTDNEKVIGRKIVDLDQEIQEKMEVLYLTVRDDLKYLKQKKDSNLSYMNPYGKMETIDGMYMDNKL